MISKIASNNPIDLDTTNPVKSHGEKHRLCQPEDLDTDSSF